MTSSRRDSTAAVRAAGAGDDVDGVTTVRRAARGDDLLLLVLTAGDSWWITRRVGGEVKVVACPGEDEAHRDFELYLGSPSPRGVWVEADQPAAA